MYYQEKWQSNMISPRALVLLSTVTIRVLYIFPTTMSSMSVLNIFRLIVTLSIIFSRVAFIRNQFPLKTNLPMSSQSPILLTFFVISSSNSRWPPPCHLEFEGDVSIYCTFLSLCIFLALFLVSPWLWLGSRHINSPWFKPKQGPHRSTCLYTYRPTLYRCST